MKNRQAKDRKRTFHLKVGPFLFLPLFFMAWLYSTAPSVKKMFSSLPAGLSYEKREYENHIVHILTVDPAVYKLELVKAFNRVCARESVLAMTNRKNAVAGINAGFFALGDGQDGLPSGALMVDGSLFTLRNGEQDLLALKGNEVFIGKARGTIKVSIQGKPVSIARFNRSARSNSVALYNYNWGTSTVTDRNRKEIIVGKDQTIKKICYHGDAMIPHKGWVLSFPQEASLETFKIGDKVEVSATFVGDTSVPWDSVSSLVRGIPIIVENGVVAKFPDSTFAQKHHARTALGISSDKKIVLVVVEHRYTQNLGSVTLTQVKEILEKEGYSRLRLLVLTLSELRSIVEKHLVKDSHVVGLSLSELAKLMIDLGCQQAINLDGGGSSTMCIQGKVINTATGDEDESLGLVTTRLVSDALVVARR